MDVRWGVAGDGVSCPYMSDLPRCLFLDGTTAVDVNTKLPITRAMSTSLRHGDMRITLLSDSLRRHA